MILRRYYNAVVLWSINLSCKYKLGTRSPAHSRDDSIYRWRDEVLVRLAGVISYSIVQYILTIVIVCKIRIYYCNIFHDFHRK